MNEMQAERLINSLELIEKSLNSLAEETKTYRELKQEVENKIDHINIALLKMADEFNLNIKDLL